LDDERPSKKMQEHAIRRLRRTADEDAQGCSFIDLGIDNRFDLPYYRSSSIGDILTFCTNMDCERLPMESLNQTRPVIRRSAKAEAAPPDATAAIAKALGHPARIQIVRLLLQKQSCIGCDIVDQVSLAQSTVSEHLRILKAAGIITGEIERPRVCYSLNPEALMPLAALLNAVFEKDARGAFDDAICCPPKGETA
jgi:ArsR family transcriptional regulator